MFLFMYLICSYSCTWYVLIHVPDLFLFMYLICSYSCTWYVYFRSSSTSASTRPWPSCLLPWGSVLRIWLASLSCSSSSSWLSHSSAICCSVPRSRTSATSRTPCKFWPLVYACIVYHRQTFVLKWSCESQSMSEIRLRKTNSRYLLVLHVFVSI